MKKVFDLFDKDGDGKISQSELQECLKTLSGEKTMTDKDIRDLIGEEVEGMFTQRGGAIDFELFKSIVVRPAAQPAQRRARAPAPTQLVRHGDQCLCLCGSRRAARRHQGQKGDHGPAGGVHTARHQGRWLHRRR